MRALLDNFSQLDWSISWWSLLVGFTYVVALLSVPSVLLERRGRPQAALTWILAMFTLPVIGLLCWWAFGRPFLKRKRRRRRRAADQMNRSLQQLRNTLPDTPPTAPQGEPLEHIPDDDAEWTFPPTQRNRVKLLVDGEQFFPAIAEAIAAAEHHIHLLFYIWRDDATGRRFRDLLAARAHDGVEVRLLGDGYGSPALGRSFIEPLKRAGGQVAQFQPARFFSRRPQFNFRNHRKLVIVDGRSGFLGGLNVGDEYTHDWHDFGMRVVGPAVDQLQEVFVDDWYFTTKEDLTSPRYFGRWDGDPPTGPLETEDDTNATCAVVASGPHTRHNFTRDALFMKLVQAERRVWIMTPYFVPDQAILTAMRTAVYRGVDVRLTLPAKTDSRLAQLAARSYYGDLLHAGIKLYEYQPVVLHAKMCLIDDDLSVVGSANMDIRSFRLNFELNCFVHSRPLAQRLVRQFQDDLECSREITLEDVENRSRFKKLIEAAAHLMSPLI